MDLSLVVRNILASQPRVTHFAIEWDAPAAAPTTAMEDERSLDVE